jgi:hypothetical protein
MDLQQAKIYKEQANQASIDTRRRLFDEIMYERSHTPSFNEKMEQLQAHALRRAQLTAPITEIWSGKSLNDLLGDLKKLNFTKAQGPDMELSPEILKQINVRAGAKAIGNIGILRNDGRLSWPIGLKDLKPSKTAEEIRTFLDNKALTAVQQAVNGKVSTGIIRDLRSKVKELHKLLAKNVSELPTNEYIEAKKYLNHFDDAIDLLTRDDVGNYFNQTYAAKGKTVKDLVKYMLDKGLTFAPAVSGDERAYQTLHQLLAAYDLAARQEMHTDKERKEE